MPKVPLSSIFDDDPCVFIEMDSRASPLATKFPRRLPRAPWLGAVSTRRKRSDSHHLRQGRYSTPFRWLNSLLRGDLTRGHRPETLSRWIPRRSSPRSARPPRNCRSWSGYTGRFRPQTIRSDPHGTVRDLAGPVGRVGGANIPVPYASSLDSCLPTSRSNRRPRCLGELRDHSNSNRARIPRLGVAVEEGQITDCSSPKR